MGSAIKREAEKVWMLSGQYERLQRAWSENAMLFHDMENHLQTVSYLAEQGKNEEIREYISRISRPVKELAGVFFTGVGIVDAVLGSRQDLARRKGYGMDINAQLPANTGIAENDFCTILTNLLDNAIESMDRERADKGEICVSIRSIRHFLVICVSNPCGENPLQGRNWFSTSKADRTRHGWGLKSVRRTVQKYNGSLSLEREDGRFVAAAMLFFPSAPGK